MKEAFELLDANNTGYIEVKDLKVALRALGFEPAKEEIKRLISDLTNTNSNKDRDRDNNKEGSVPIDFSDFLDIMTTKMSEKDSDQEKSDAANSVRTTTAVQYPPGVKNEMLYENIPQLVRAPKPYCCRGFSGMASVCPEHR